MNTSATHRSLPLILVLMVMACGMLVHAESWTVTPTGATANLNAITMLTDNVGFIAGENGVLLRTTNAGVSWIQQRIASGFTKNLYGVTVVDTNSFGEAVGDQGAALERDPSIGAFSNYPQGTDTLYGTCQRPDSVVTLMSVGTNGFLGQHQWHTYSYQYYDANYNLVDTTIIYVSMIQIPTGVTATLRSIVFNAATGYIVGDSGVVLKSTDNGNTWAVHSVGANEHLRSIAWFDTHKLIAVGLNGSMWLSTNDGGTWNNVTPPGLATNLRGVSFIDIHNGAIVGDNALIMQTADGGLTWQRVGVNTFVNLRGISCLPTSVGFGWYAVGDSGTLVQTRYGGSPVSYTRDASTLDFGGVNVGARKNMLINYTNTSATGYVTVKIVCSDPRVAIAPSQFMMEAETNGKVKVTFTPVDTTPVHIALLETDDATWLTDTIRVTGYGLAAMVELQSDTVVFDTAWAGRVRTVDAINTGNLPVSASVVSVSDTNFTVLCDSVEQPDKHITFTILLKHTVKHEINAFAVLRTNDDATPLDTIHIIAHAAPLAVAESAVPTTPATTVYPNPSRVGTTVTVRTGEALRTTTVRVFDINGNVVMEETLPGNSGSIELLNTSTLHAGQYFYQIMTPDGYRSFGGFVRN